MWLIPRLLRKSRKFVVSLLLRCLAGINLVSSESL
jgi:hypothetical protein